MYLLLGTNPDLHNILCAYSLECHLQDMSHFFYNFNEQAAKGPMNNSVISIFGVTVHYANLHNCRGSWSEATHQRGSLSIGGIGGAREHTEVAIEHTDFAKFEEVYIRHCVY